MTRQPRLVLVPGEPAGIGPELCVRLAQQPRQDCQLVAFADPDTLRAAAGQLGLPLQLLAEDQPAHQPGELRCRPIRNRVATTFGQPSPDNAAAVIQALANGADACLGGEFDGLVTGPVHKAAINAGGIPYTGTTELLAERARCPVVMMLANDIVRVALVTTHLPLRAVADAITAHQLQQVLEITRRALQQDFGIAEPVIAVLGLNPHAGEAGILGDEEINVIEPVMRQLRTQGRHLVGPLPADTAFLPQKLRGFDAVVAMYHDQGLPVLKYSGFEQAVNITLGLPYPRVAVDHGTALELAGKGLADPASLFAAVSHCARFAAQRKLHA
ncbi:4-hydroxythreonine-4-phosphate dehydrogenase PdxA [Pseudoxanthomonas dokdonensis]|uniref:4-hydroxythreonine-4-phosphate dehydrogenase n=1 Tax=Pseudoxanthomonas dokdonensis TaxID=344882 RepID=A0A0R0CXI4_9GAMM|nr:4-hydroxythreonine-4-phosphate dehydrogenase PdxA [Pseudoxanthomonas dokdonensis]KRG71234.1 4-hydroxythreonine-4-phosphate dehydrogenase [Pseudoxanthomonas dokdonensis]